MMEQERMKLIGIKAIKASSQHAQIGMFIEEVGELLTALNQHSRGRVDVDAVVTEIADVKIMTEQLALMYGYQKVDAEVERKLQRLEERIKKGTLV